MGIQLDFSGKHAPKITNRWHFVLAGFPNLCDSLCILMRFCELMIQPKITQKRCQTKNLYLKRNSCDLEGFSGTATAILADVGNPLPREETYLETLRHVVDSTKKSVQDRLKDCFKGDGSVHEAPLYRVASQGEPAGRFAEIHCGMTSENAGFVITFVSFFHISTSSRSTWRRGESNPVHIVLLLRRHRV
jgi:hypothetical protein